MLLKTSMLWYVSMVLLCVACATSEKGPPYDRMDSLENMMMSLESKVSDIQSKNEDLHAENLALVTKYDEILSENQRLWAKISSMETEFQREKISSKAQVETTKKELEKADRACRRRIVHPVTSETDRQDSQVGQALVNGATNDEQDAHVVQLRSDDGGVLQAVVDQMSQRLTQLTADVSAFKASTNTELQSLRTNTDNEVQTLRTDNTRQDQDIQAATTSTYIHWGSASCSNSSQLVYSGVVGGSEPPQTNSNTMCLTLSPVMADRNPVNYPHINGAEYDTNDGHLNKDAVCAVCKTTRSATIMIPGTNVCTPGWSLEYSGLLMGGNNNQHGAEWICVDSAMEERLGSGAHETSHLLHYTKTVCGSLPCPPYVDGKIVTCVVCSK